MINTVQAESELADKDKREELDAVIKQARSMILKNLGLPSTASATSTPPLPANFSVLVRQQTKDLLIEEEVRRRKAVKMNLANEGLEARKKEEEVVAKKRKAEEDKQWEGKSLHNLFFIPNCMLILFLETREQRVDSWRSFAGANKKKKKGPKVQILG
jgi:DnaJ homolog subfamily C member 8